MWPLTLHLTLLVAENLWRMTGKKSNGWSMTLWSPEQEVAEVEVHCFSVYHTFSTSVPLYVTSYLQYLPSLPETWLTNVSLCCNVKILSHLCLIHFIIIIVWKINFPFSWTSKMAFLCLSVRCRTTVHHFSHQSLAYIRQWHQDIWPISSAPVLLLIIILQHY